MADVDYAIYNPNTGEIRAVGYGDETLIPLELETGEDFLTGIDPTIDDDTHYVDGGSIVERPTVPATWNQYNIRANGVEEAVLSTLPNPATIVVFRPNNAPGIDFTSTEYTVTDGSFDFATTTAAAFEIRTETFPYRYQTWVITAHEELPVETRIDVNVTPSVDVGIDVAVASTVNAAVSGSATLTGAHSAFGAAINTTSTSSASLFRGLQ